MRRITFVLLLLTFPTALSSRELTPIILKIPDSSLTVTLTQEPTGALVYEMRAEKKIILDRSELALEIEGTRTKHFQILGSTSSNRDTTWSPLYGERRVIRDHYNQVDIELLASGPSHLALTLTLRCANEGIAFRFSFPGQHSKKDVHLNEKTQFSFTDDFSAWAVTSAQGEYSKTNISKIKKGCERPLVVEIADDLYAAIGEAGLVDYSRMKFQVQSKKEFTLVSQLDSHVAAWPAADH